MSAEIIIEDSAIALTRIESDSIHCVVTSPPYDSIREYGGHSWDFKTIAAELFRVLTPGGVLCWNVGDACVNGSETLTSMRQAIHFVDAVSFRMHDTMIWQKSNFANPSNNRYHQLWEYIFILSKGKPRCFNPILDKPNKYINGTLGKNTMRHRNGEMLERPITAGREFGMRGNVWLGNTRGQEDICQSQDHPAKMPRWLARDLIISFSNPTDLILDPFAGSGTTGAAAISQNRRFIGIEINPDYLPMLQQAVAQQSLAI